MKEPLFELSALELDGDLGAVEVNLLRFELDAPLGAEQLAPLSAAERDRCVRFQHQADRVRFVAARRALRRLLASRLGVTPEAVPIEIDAHGKPFVREAPALSFGISHSGSLGLIAVSTRQRVGVDVERLSPSFAWADVAREVMTPAELASLDALSEADARARFYWLWVRKEALAKALGTGLARDLRRLSVDPATTEIDGERVRWVALSVGAEYRAALAALERL